MTTKFNQVFYAQIKAKKNEALSSIGQHRLRLTDKEKEKEKEVVEKGSSAPALDEGWVASSALSVKEISPLHKKCKMSEKGKGKIGARVWADTKTTLARANKVVTPDKLKEISGVPSHEMVNCHIHKLFQVTSLHLLSSLVLFYLFIYY